MITKFSCFFFISKRQTFSRNLTWPILMIFEKHFKQSIGGLRNDAWQKVEHTGLEACTLRYTVYIYNFWLPPSFYTLFCTSSCIIIIALTMIQNLNGNYYEPIALVTLSTYIKLLLTNPFNTFVFCKDVICSSFETLPWLYLSGFYWRS